MKSQWKKILLALLLINGTAVYPCMAESSIKEIREFEKCIDKALKDEAKKGDVKVRFLAKKCQAELDALLDFAQRAKSQGLTIADEDKVSIGPGKRIGTVN
jgi:hypothetical protein